MSRASSVPEMTRMRMPVCAVDLGDEVAAVVGFAGGAGGGGDDLVDLVRLGQPLELRQRLQRRRHGRRRQAAAVEAAGAEPDHVLFAVDDLERQIRPHLHHDHVDRVGADVDGGDAHAESGGTGKRWRPGGRPVPLHGRYILAGQLVAFHVANVAKRPPSYHEPR